MPDTLERLRAALAGRYAVERQLGHGGMATVYLARDVRHEREVAIKVLLPELAASLGSERFLREIKVAARLQHPHILPLHDSGEADGLLFYVMPYVEGESLRDRLDRERQLPIAEAVRIAREVADALAFAHSHDVVHRDIKPENILLEAGHAVASDFGIARAISAAAGERLTETGLAIGTAAYMSPEQATGERTLDGRSDIYSLGCVLYEMLAGEPPFTGPTAQAVIARRLSEHVPRLSLRREAVPERLEQVVTKTLARTPADRFTTAAELVDALADPALTTPAAGAPVASAPVAVRLLRRPSRRLLALAGIAVIALAVVSVPLSRLRNRPPAAPAAPRVVVLPFQNLGAPEDEYFADGITEEITARLASVSGLTVISRTSAMRYRNTDKPLQEIGAELRVQYVLEGTIRWQRGAPGQSRVRVTPQLIRVADDGHLWASVYDTVMAEVFGIQTSIAQQVVRALGVALRDPERQAITQRPTENLEAFDLYLRGNASYKRSYLEADLRVARDLYQRAVELDAGFADAWARLSIADSRLYFFSYDRTETRLSLAKSAADRALELDPRSPEAHLAQGYYYYFGRRDYSRALEYFGIAERLQPSNGETIEAIGFVFRRLGRWEEALRYLERAVELGPNDGVPVVQLATTLHALRRYDEADRLYDSAAALSPDDPFPYARKLWLYAAEPPRARRVLERALQAVGSQRLRAEWFSSERQLLSWWHTGPLSVLEEYRAMVREGPGGLAEAQKGGYYVARAAVEAQLGDEGSARVYYDSARVMLEAMIRQFPQRWEAHALLGIVYAALDRRAEAVRAARRATEILPLSVDAFWGASLAANLALVYAMAGEEDSAIVECERVLALPGSGFMSRALLRVHPALARLRENPRFGRLLEGP